MIILLLLISAALSKTKAAGGPQTDKTPDPMKGNRSSKPKVDKDDRNEDNYEDTYHDGMKNMTLNDPNNVVLNVDEPWMNLPAIFTQKVEK